VIKKSYKKKKRSIKIDPFFLLVIIIKESVDTLLESFFLKTLENSYNFEINAEWFTWVAVKRPGIHSR
jgi:hypothetical protein